MAYHLTVVSPFGAHQRGSLITDPVEVAAVLAGENSGHVVQTEAPEPAAAPAAHEGEG